MGNVIRMDLYRLVKSMSFKVCLIIVFLLNIIEGPLGKIMFNLGKKLAEQNEDPEKALAQLGEWDNTFHFGNVLADQLGMICTAIFLLCIVWFCYADIQHGYIKNIAGQLPSRGHTIISKFVVIQFTTLLFYVVTVIGNTAGQLLVGRHIVFDMRVAGDFDEETLIRAEDKIFGMGSVLAEFAIKWILLTGLCALVLLLTTAVGSNVAGTIVAILCGAGFTGLAYTGISAGINKLFKFKEEFALSDYMPDSLYRTNLNDEGCMLRALIVGIITVVVLLYFTTTLYNKKDIK